MRGYTLLEAVTVLILLGVGASSVAPAMRRVADRAAVVTAREELIAAVLETRAAGIAAGTSEITLIADPPSWTIRADGAVLRSATFADAITLRIGAGRDSTTIRFDAFGLGRFANETIELIHSGATTSVVVSSYGRVRRR